MRIEDMTHLNVRKWRHKNIKLIKIEDEETCNMLFNSNYFGAFLNEFCTVILLGGFGNTENFSVRTLRTVLRTRIENFVLGVWGSQMLTVRIVRTHLGGKTPNLQYIPLILLLLWIITGGYDSLWFLWQRISHILCGFGGGARW